MTRCLQLARTAGVVLAAAIMLAAAPARGADTASPNDVARLLAGLPPAPDSAVAPFTDTGAWRQHARYFDAAWARLEARQLSRIRDWSKENIPARRPTTFYMFSGPDFLYVHAFLPGSATYVLSGLEPVGHIPGLEHISHRTVPGILANLRASTGSVLNISFFLTKNMSAQLRYGRLTGTLPILYTFLARAGKTITDVSLIALEPDGSAKPWDGRPVRGVPNGVKIDFTSQDGKAQTLYYFSTDVSNGGIKSSGFLEFCKRLGPGDAFVKSASYLMHSDSFSTVREFLLANTAAIVQDDTGVPVRFFKPDEWELRPFGRYLGPIGLFAGRYQRQLADIFRTNRAKPIPFGVGYRWRPNESNLLLATRQERRAAN
jgi:hypothetical protein